MALKKFIETRNAWDHKPILVAVDDIKSVGAARSPAEALIRHKSGGYTVVEATYAQIAAVLAETE